MNIKNRLDLYIKWLGLSGRRFVKICGFPEGSYSSIKDGVGADKLREILINFPNLNIEWLITGKGEMIKNEECVRCKELEKELEDAKTAIRYLRKLDLEEVESLKKSEILEYPIMATES